MTFRRTGRRRLAAPGAGGALLGLLGAVLLASCQPMGQESDPGRTVSPVDRTDAAAAAAGRPAVPPGEPASRQTARAMGQASAVQETVPDTYRPTPDTHRLTPDAPPKATAFTIEAPLSQRLKAVAEEAVSQGVARSIGVAVYDMATEQGYGLNHDLLFKPASVIKLAVLVGAYRAREKMPPRQFEKLRPDLERMITLSDNPATRRLVRRLGVQRINMAIRELGIRRFRVGTSGSQTWVLQGSQAAPADTALLLARIARREVVSPQACDEMLALLGAQTKRHRIPAGLPEGSDLWVGNKTGTLSGIVNDAGIVLQPQRGIAYTLAIYTSGARSEKAGEKLLADLSAVVYGYLSSRRSG